MSNRVSYGVLAVTGVIVAVVLFLAWQRFSLRQTPPAIAQATSTATLPVIVTNTPTHTPTPSPTATSTPPPTPTPTPTPIVVLRHVEQLGRLETTEFVMQTVIDLENRPTNLWEQLLVGPDALTLVAEGEVVAGLDLSAIDPDNIVVTGTTVTIVLPPPEVFYTRLNNENTYIVERRTDLLRNINPTLESRARKLAENQIQTWAIERGILDNAAQDAAIVMENLLRSLGFTDITIEFDSEEI